MSCSSVRQMRQVSSSERKFSACAKHERGFIEETLEKALNKGKRFTKTGRVATYIPELSKANPEHIGVCIKTVTGETYSAGDWHEPFTMQSISKTISLTLALQTAGYDKVFSKVGLEPTGDSFNSIVKLETKTPHPLNPMINAGAIATASCIPGEDPFELYIELARKICLNKDIYLNSDVYLSEKRAGMRNRSMAYWMKSENIIEGDPEEALDLYFRMCSVNVTAEDLANWGMVLANDGVDPISGDRLVESWIVRIVKTFMVTCGMYDGSGEFAIKVGIPSKSGVGGGILSAVEGRMGIGVFNPSLDQKGNSVGGMHLLECLSKNLNLHYFAGKSMKQ
ncbi:MAG: glutaminase A [Synergistaceae bacterium]|nr:glutaminase A [Synergistaceae bacterium]